VTITPDGYVYRNLHRFEASGGTRFLTFSCNHRWQLFKNDTIKDAFAQHLENLRQQKAFRLCAWVVMPEHVHLLLNPAPTSTGRRVVTQIKASFARRVIARWIELKAPILPKLIDGKGKYHFWLPGGGHDRNIFSADEYKEKFNYIHDNPVRRGLVAKQSEWPWSSARWYACMKDGIVRLD
jgi:putative transposase